MKCGYDPGASWAPCFQDDQEFELSIEVVEKNPKYSQDNENVGKIC